MLRRVCEIICCGGRDCIISEGMKLKVILKEFCVLECMLSENKTVIKCAG